MAADDANLEVAVARLDERVAGVVHTLDKMDSTLSDISQRMVALERSDSSRKGQEGVLMALARSPLAGWIVGIVGVVILWMEKRV